MFIYDNMNELEDENRELSIAPLAYVVLDCGR